MSAGVVRHIGSSVDATINNRFDTLDSRNDRQALEQQQHLEHEDCHQHLPVGAADSGGGLADNNTAFRQQRPRAAAAKKRKGRAGKDPVGRYLQSLRKAPLLSKEEEIVLGRKIQRGMRCEHVRDRLEARHGMAPTYDEWAKAMMLATTEELLQELDTADTAKRSMVSANLRLVAGIAKRYRHRGLSLTDLIQEGTFGLVKASEKFNPELGFKFSTYATWWIKQSIMNAIANQVSQP